MPSWLLPPGVVTLCPLKHKKVLLGQSWPQNTVRNLKFPNSLELLLPFSYKCDIMGLIIVTTECSEQSQ